MGQFQTGVSIPGIETGDIPPASNQLTAQYGPPVLTDARRNTSPPPPDLRDAIGDYGSIGRHVCLYGALNFVRIRNLNFKGRMDG